MLNTKVLCTAVISHSMNKWKDAHPYGVMIEVRHSGDILEAFDQEMRERLGQMFTFKLVSYLPEHGRQTFGVV